MKQAFTFIFSMLALVALAQPELPQASPTTTIKQNVGLSTVEITYSRPGVKGRTIFGDLVPYNEIWRTGANKATAITLSSDATIGGKTVPAGSYSIFTVPGKTQWEVIINKETELWGTGNYDKAEDVVRFKVDAKSLSNNVETFTIDLRNFSNEGCEVVMMWEKTEVSFKLGVDANAQAWKNIKSEISKVEGSWRVYVRSAQFAADSKENLEEALEYLDKAIEMGADESWWTFWVQGQVYAAMKDYKKAQASIKKSIKLGKENKNWSYEKRLTDLLAEYEAAAKK